MTSESVFIGRDNPIILQLEDNNSGVMAASDLSAFTKLELVVDGETVFDSTVETAAIAFTAGGLVTLKPGLLLSSPGEHEIELVFYGATHTNGLVWRPKLHVVAETSLP